MTRKTLAGAMAFALISFCGATFALADDPNSQPRPSLTSADSASGPQMARGTDLRPCQPGQHSEFSRLTGGYRCVRNP